MSLVCGDGVRDPVKEECDDGNSSDADACATDCHRRDQLVSGAEALEHIVVRASEVIPAEVVPLDVPDAGPVDLDAGDGGIAPSPGRRMGTGRHAVAANASGAAVVFHDEATFAVQLAAYTESGVPNGYWSAVSNPAHDIEGSNPVVAIANDGTFVAVWTDSNGDGDEAGIAVRRVDPTTGPLGDIVHVNETAEFAQYDPDIIATSASSFVVAWTDDSDLSTGPDVKLRALDASGKPMGTEVTLAATPDVESDVSLSVFADDWAAAWRAAGDSGESVHCAVAGGSAWSIGPFLGAPTDDRPALVALDTSHLFLIYTEGVDTDGDGVAEGSKIRYALLDIGATGAVSGTDLTPFDPLGLGAASSQSQPHATFADNNVYVSWRSSAIDGSARGEDVWLRRIQVVATDGGGWAVDLDASDPEITLPRSSGHNGGPQRYAGLAASPLAPHGAIAAVWEDWGQNYGLAEGAQDVIFELIPVPIVDLE